MKVIIANVGGYPLSSNELQKKLVTFLSSLGLPSNILVEIAVISESDMVTLGKMYLHEKGSRAHNVLSFVETEVLEFVQPPDKLKHLGTVAVCFPVAENEARLSGILVDEKVYELAKHGILHLIGQHHH